MPVIAKCRECGKQYRLRDDQAGATLPCKACGADFRVPGTPARRPAASAGNRPPARGARKSRYGSAAPPVEDDFDWDEPAPGSKAMTYWLIGGGSLAVVLIGVIVGVMMFTGDKDKDDDVPGDSVASTDTQPDDSQPQDPAGGFNNDNNRRAANRRRPGNGFNNRRPGNPPKKNPVAQNPGRQPPGNIQPPVNPGNLQPGNNNPIPPEQPANIVRGNDPNSKKPIPRTSPSGWKAKPDPPAEKIVFENKGKLVIPSPINPRGGNAIYPSTNSAFVALGSNRDARRDFRVVKDLRTNTKVGEVRGLKLFFSKGVLSPDGAHFAAFDRDAKAIALFDVRKGRLLGRLPIADQKARSAFRMEILDFAGPNRLVAAGRNTPLWVWSVPDGKAERSIPLPTSYSKESIAFSPGGRYLALMSTESGETTIQVLDLTTGDGAGAISLPKEFGSFRCHGMSFSPDGTELAGLFNIFFSHRLYCWNFSTGQSAVVHAFEKDPQHISRNYKGPALQWFPDKSRWLAHGNVVIDRESGKPIWTVPKIDGSMHDSEARLLGSDRIALVGRQRLVTALATLEISKEELAKAAKVVKSGGTEADVRLPPLKPADYAGVRLIPIDGVAGQWGVAPDPAPKAAAAALLRSSMSIGAGLGRIKAVELAAADAGIAVVVSENNGSRRNQPGAVNQNPPELRLERYDVAASKPLDSYDVTFKSTFLALSPSGKRAAVKFRTGDDRIDVFALDMKTPVAGFRPYKQEKNAHQRRIQSAFFVDDDHVVTVSTNHKLVMWKLPECKAVYALEKAMNPGVSANRGFLSVTSGQSCRLFNALTGEPVGDLRLGGIAQKVAFHPNGTRAAVTVTTASGYELAVFSMADGKVESRFPIPQYGTALEWCGDQHLLMNNALLVDLNAKAVVWNYRLSFGAHSPTSPDGRHWYVVATTPITLNAVQLPDPATTQQLAGKNLTPKMILKPGMKVSLNVQLNGINAPNLNGEIVRNWTDKLRKAGITVAPGQPVTLFARADSSSTGKSVTFRPSMFSRFGRGRGGGANRGNETVQQTKINCRIVFGLGNKSYGERKTSITNVTTSSYFPQRVTLKEGESVQTKLQKMQSDRAAAFFRGYTPPSHIFDAQSARGLGTSQFTAGGTKPLGR